jgi:hypothetical protein
MGIRNFAREIIKPELATTYKGYEVSAIGDPSGTKRADTDERTCYQELMEAGIPATPARSNSLQARFEAVNGFLTKMIEGKPAMELSPDCKVLRKGFNGGYRYRRISSAGDEKYHNIPEKNRFSHIHDALQYAALFMDSSLNISTDSTYARNYHVPDVITPYSWT